MNSRKIPQSIIHRLTDPKEARELNERVASPDACKRPKDLHQFLMIAAHRKRQILEKMLMD